MTVSGSRVRSAALVACAALAVILALAPATRAEPPRPPAPAVNLDLWKEPPAVASLRADMDSASVRDAPPRIDAAAAVLAPDDPHQLTIKAFRALVLLETGKVQEALDLLNAQPLAPQLEKRAPGVAATVLLARTAILLELQKSAEAAADVAHALSLIEPAGDPLNQRAEAYTYRAVINQYAEKVEEAEADHRLALSLRTGNSQADLYGKAQNAGGLALILVQKGRPDEALEPAREAMEAFRRSTEPGNRLRQTSSHNVANILTTLGRSAEALQVLDESITECVSAADVSGCDLANGMGMRGVLLARLGRLVEAERMLTQSLSRLENAEGARSATYGLYLQNLAAIRRELGHEGAAAPLMEESLRILSAFYPPTHSLLVTARMNLASVHLSRGEIDDAIAVLENAIALSRESTLEPVVAQRLMSEAMLALARLGDRPDRAALEAAETTIDVVRKRHVGLSTRTLSLTTNMAGRWLDAGYPEDALRQLALLDAALTPDARNISGVLAAREVEVRALAAAGRRDEALALARTELDARDLRSVLGVSRADIRDRSPREDSRRRALAHSGLDVLSARGRGPFPAGEQEFRFMQAALENPAIEFVAAAAAAPNALAPKAVGESLRNREAATQARIAAERKLLRAFEAGNVPREQMLALVKDVNLTETDLLKADAALREVWPAYSALDVQATLTLDAFQRALRPNETAVLASVGADAVYVMAVSREQAMWKREPVDRNTMCTLARSMRRSLDPARPLSCGRLPGDTPEGVQIAEATGAGAPLQRGSVAGAAAAFDRSAAHRLYTIVFGGLEASTPRGRTLIINTQGVLATLPWAALVTEPPAGRDSSDLALRNTAWLIRSHPVAYMASPRTLTLQRDAAATSTRQGFAGVGAPCGFEDAPCGNEQADATPAWSRATLGPLAMARSELDSLARRFGRDSLVLTGKDATEAQVRAAPLGDRRVLAFATHALTAGEMGALEPTLLLSPGRPGLEGDDGLLGASEIVSGFRLSAEWVLLSACNTARTDGRPADDGFGGLVRAFQAAGARNVLATLFPLRDDVAGEITPRLFASRDEDRARLLQQAMLRLMANRSVRGSAHPSAWSTFAIYGDPGR